MKRLMLAIVVLYVLSQAFDSVVRWGLDVAGAGFLIYVRDFSLVLAVPICCSLLVRNRQDIAKTFWLLSCFAFATCVALCTALAPPQILFGLKVWLPLLCGFLIVEAGICAQLDLRRGWFALWAVLCLGIFVNYFYRFPWIGLTTQIGEVAVSANREWSAAGVQRLSGFSRSSYDGAILILLLYLYLIVLAKSWLTRVTLVIFSGAAITLTTSKGVMAAFLATTLLLPLLAAKFRSDGRIKGLLMAGLIGIAALGALAPLLALQIPFPRIKEGTPEAMVFGSLLSRAWDTWPRALSLVSDWQLFTGRGLGGIGSAQALFEPVQLSTADNLFVYLYVTAGVLGGLLYALNACASYRLQLANPFHRIALLWLFDLYLYGLTTNIVESALMAMVMGGLLSVLLARSSQTVRSGVRFEPERIPKSV
jgi:hypothetical protein